MLGLSYLYLLSFLVITINCSPNDSKTMMDKILKLETLVSNLASKDLIEKENQKRIHVLEDKVNFLKENLEESNRERKLLRETVQDLTMKMTKLSTLCSKQEDINAKEVDNNSSEAVVLSKNMKSQPNMTRKGAKRLLGSLNSISQTSTLEGVVAFHAYMKTNEPNPGPHHTLIFDVEKTDVGGGYNHFTGVFTAPVAGAYVLTWTIVCDRHGYIFTEMTVNNNPTGGILTDALEVNDIHTVTGIIVTVLNAGDAAFVRTSPNDNHVKGILSDPTYRTSFSGWKLS